MSWCAPADQSRPEWALNQTVVEGPEAALRLLRDGSLERISLTGTTEHRPVALSPDDQVYLAGYVATQAHLIEGLQRSLAHETMGADTIKTMDVVWAADGSAEEGRRVLL
jgi:hypothetical protein